MTEKVIIYAMRSQTTGDAYIGKTAGLFLRKAAHLTLLRRKKHRCLRLQRLFNELGETDFEFVVLETLVLDLDTTTLRFWNVVAAANAERYWQIKQKNQLYSTLLNNRLQPPGSLVYAEHWGENPYPKYLERLREIDVDALPVRPRGRPPIARTASADGPATAP